MQKMLVSLEESPVISFRITTRLCKFRFQFCFQEQILFAAE